MTLKHKSLLIYQTESSGSGWYCGPFPSNISSSVAMVPSVTSPISSWVFMWHCLPRNWPLASSPHSISLSRRRSKVSEPVYLSRVCLCFSINSLMTSDGDFDSKGDMVTLW